MNDFKSIILNKIKTSKPFILIFSLLNRLDTLSKSSKAFLILCLDLFLIIISFLITNFFLIETKAAAPTHLLPLWIIPIMILFSCIFYILNGDYLSISRYIKSSEIYNIAKRNFILITIVIINPRLYISSNNK